MNDEARLRTGVHLLRAGILSSGVLSVLMVLTPLPGHLFSWIALGDWSSFATRGEVGDYANFSYAVTGAVMLGWMVTLWWMTTQVRDGVPGAWRVTAVSVVGWFVIDSTTSVARGYPGNALLNTALAAVLFAGLAMTHTRDTRRTTATGAPEGY